LSVTTVIAIYHVLRLFQLVCM